MRWLLLVLAFLAGALGKFDPTGGLGKMTNAQLGSALQRTAEQAIAKEAAKVRNAATSRAFLAIPSVSPILIHTAIVPLVLLTCRQTPPWILKT